MLTYKKIRIAFYTIWVVVIAFQFYYQFSFFYLLIPVVLYQGVLIWGAIKINRNFFIPSINEGKTSKNEIAITFDDGPINIGTSKILDVLKSNQVEATFFVIGKHVEQHPDIVKRIHEEGHIIGNHSYSHHFFFDFYSVDRMKEELIQTNHAVFKLIGKNMKFFRPPYGVTNPNLANAIIHLKLCSIGWNIRSMDTVVKVEQKLLDNIIPKLKPGSIVLLHDTPTITIECLQSIIDAIRAKGFTIVRLDKLINIEPYA